MTPCIRRPHGPAEVALHSSKPHDPASNAGSATEICVTLGKSWCFQKPLVSCFICLDQNDKEKENLFTAGFWVRDLDCGQGFYSVLWCKQLWIFSNGPINSMLTWKYFVQQSGTACKNLFFLQTTDQFFGKSRYMAKVLALSSLDSNRTNQKK